jgi:predicted ABC-type ATPase
MTALIYLVGAPGAGKSTVMAAATERLHRRPLDGHPARDLLIGQTGPVAVELGRRRDHFSGTDALPMNAVRYAEQWLRGGPDADIVLGEGNRLGNARFLTAAVDAGLAVVLAHLVVPAAVAIERRAQRAERLGTAEQNPAWVAGATTAARRLAKHPPPGVQVVTLDGRRPSPALAAAVWDLAHMTQRRTTAS